MISLQDKEDLEHALLHNGKGCYEYHHGRRVLNKRFRKILEKIDIIPISEQNEKFIDYCVKRGIELSVKD